MLQLNRISSSAILSLAQQAPFPPAWSTWPELERTAEDWRRGLLLERSKLAKEHWMARLVDTLDRRLRTETVEYLDRPDFPSERKLRLVRALHRINRMLGTYRLCFRVLEPLLRSIADQERRPVRLLELACGAGEFTLTIARMARARGLNVVATGSDYIPEYVSAAQRLAKIRNSDARFIELDALDLSSRCRSGEFDVTFIAQSMHHFSPGQLAKMIAQSRRVATTAFVGVDGFRSLRVLTVFPILAASALNRQFLHDAIVSVRKFYSSAELTTLGQIAAPDAHIETAVRQPGFSTLTVRWDDPTSAPAGTVAPDQEKS